MYNPPSSVKKSKAYNFSVAPSGGSFLHSHNASPQKISGPLLPSHHGQTVATARGLLRHHVVYCNEYRVLLLRLFSMRREF